MSPINFEPLIAERPELREVWSALRHWIESNPMTPFFDARRLVRDFPAISREKLVDALMTLSRLGLIRPQYRVLNSGGVFVGPYFDGIDEIPETVPDRFNVPFDVDEGEVVQVFAQSGM